MTRPAFALLLLLPCSLLACGRPAPLEVKDAWARDTVGRTANAAAFMTIRSPVDDRLVAASAPVARRTGLMTMASTGGATEMKYVEAIDIPAGQPVRLDPGGLHVWLEGLDRPLRAGEAFALDLDFEKSGRRRIAVAVIAPAAAPPVAGIRM